MNPAAVFIISLIFFIFLVIIVIILGFIYSKIGEEKISEKLAKKSPIAGIVVLFTSCVISIHLIELLYNYFSGDRHHSTFIPYLAGVAVAGMFFLYLTRKKKTGGR